MSYSLVISGEYFSSDLRDRFLSFFEYVESKLIVLNLFLEDNEVCNAPEPYIYDAKDLSTISARVRVVICYCDPRA